MKQVIPAVENDGRNEFNRPARLIDEVDDGINECNHTDDDEWDNIEEYVAEHANEYA